LITFLLHLIFSSKKSALKKKDGKITTFAGDRFMESGTGRSEHVNRLKRARSREKAGAYDSELLFLLKRGFAEAPNGL
jgi:hypothetical protein